MCGCLLHAPYCRPGLQPRHVPWLGIEPVTLWFVRQCSVHWATPARLTVDLDDIFLMNNGVAYILYACLQSIYLSLSVSSNFLHVWWLKDCSVRDLKFKKISQWLSKNSVMMESVYHFFIWWVTLLVSKFFFLIQDHKDFLLCIFLEMLCL